MPIDRYQLERFFDDNRHRLINICVAAILIALIVAGIVWWMGRWQPPPSIFDSPVDNAVAYFATDDFNALPIEERMELIAQFVDRFRGLSQDESAVLASFMAGITGDVRDQLEENVRLLLRDLMKDGADEYFTLSPEERAAYLDTWILKWMKFGERVERGEERDISDEDRLADIRRQGRRDEERMARDANDVQLSERDAVRVMDMWRREIESVASPKEQGQIMAFMRDLREHVTRE